MNEKMREALEALDDLAMVALRCDSPDAVRRSEATVRAALTQQPESEPIYQVWFSKGQWTDVPKKVYDRAAGSDRARVVYTSPQLSAQVPEVEPGLIYVLEYISDGDEDSIDDDCYEVYGETADGREGSCEVSIREYCGKAAAELRRLSAAPSIVEKQ